MSTTKITHSFYRLFKDWGWQNNLAVYGNLIANFIILILLVYIFDFILRNTLREFIKRLTEKTKTEFDDLLFKNKGIYHFSHLLTLFLVRWLTPLALVDFKGYSNDAENLIDVLSIIVIILFIRSIIRTCRDFIRTLDGFKDKPIDSYVQVFTIFTWFFGFMIIFSLLTGKDVWTFLTALGALSAVILLIFKDTILGFVASIQVSVNDMVRIGDWITMEKYAADGDVYEINLASVKVRNFDNTITTIPTYYLISDSFKNWRGMSASGGRRIKRAILIKSSSIHFLSDTEFEELKNVQLIKEYLNTRQAEIDTYNQKNQVDKSTLLNGRNQTNFGVFRKYIDAYLNQHLAINKEMMIMTRQLEPTSKGIPLEIYAFSKDKVWKNYEHIIADIFDHVLAAVPYFNLEIFEIPSGDNFNVSVENRDIKLNDTDNTSSKAKN
ncbi:mechanosensitive ion channel family protein [Mesonia ostreae]|uniref:Mechanosensitive ion channel n=1 Tax=Mesonia ostreae TaxID=861110 RepID=A0ABU2KHY1_9FLAO|nr:mechanosensitive ion channel domain-containing protein [Mesonia ostreae]MDT0294315.1 mechanosensitive ion channel [Mesonia ostreae]